MKSNLLSMLEGIFSHASRMAAFSAGIIIGTIKPTLPYIVVCFFAILLDSFSAYRLSRRVKEKHAVGDGKLKSVHIRKVFSDYLVICLLIVLCYYIDKEICTFVNDLYLANIVAAGFSLNQVLSILENESSCNSSRWAENLQTILVDKTSRHLGIDLKKTNKDT